MLFIRMLYNWPHSYLVFLSTNSFADKCIAEWTLTVKSLCKENIFIPLSFSPLSGQNGWGRGSWMPTFPLYYLSEVAAVVNVGAKPMEGLFFAIPSHMLLTHSLTHSRSWWTKVRITMANCKQLISTASKTRVTHAVCYNNAFLFVTLSNGSLT